MLRQILPIVLVFAASVSAGAQTPTKTEPEGTKIDASRGGVTISSGVNSLTIGARMQVRWTLDRREQFEGDTVGPDVGNKDGVQSAFDIPRLRLVLSGGVYKPWLRYAVQLEMSRAPGEGGSRLKDAYFEIRPAGRPFRFQAGQFKAPFGLQQLTSSTRLQFVDRAITDLKFNPSRDQGAMFGGTVAGQKFGYDLGIFNGSGESVRQNNRSHLWVARAFVHPLGAYTLSETAVDATDKGVLHLGVAVRGGKQIRGRTTTGVFDNADNQQAVGVEFAYKRPRFYTTAEHFWMTDEQQIPTAGADLKSRGYHVQVGYMPKPKIVDLALLYANVDGNKNVNDASVREIRGVFGYFFQAHNLKLQADAGQIAFGSRYATLSSRARQGLPALGTRLVTAEDITDAQLRVQLQLVF